MLTRWIRGRLARTTTLVATSLIVFSAISASHPDSADARSANRHASASNNHAKRIHKPRSSRKAAGLPNDMLNNPRYAAIVVDMTTGRTLYEASPNALRHPASITKVMTLYMLFEQLQAKRISLSTQLPVSSNAAYQPPTKLGLRPGSTISVEDAIKGMVTRSANDAAVVVAEALGGSEERFAALMTRKARALGMSRTRYVNASGLPDSQQITTAHDLAILGIAIQKRFPAYFRYFSVRSFVFRGREIGNHNRLLGSVDGVDGIKTGYTNSSGFNLLTSLKRDNRRIVSVVMGGRSAASRDALMRRLLDNYVPRAYADSGSGPAAFSPPVEADTDMRASSVSMAPQPLPAARPVMNSETASLPSQSTATTPPSPPQRSVSVDNNSAQIQQIGAQAGTMGKTMRWVAGPAPVSTAPAVPPRKAVASEEQTPDITATASATGWVIQVGATDSENAARQLLASAKAAGSRSLASANPFTESVNRNGSKLWRARFGGFGDKQEAIEACRKLHEASFNCVAVRL